MPGALGSFQAGREAAGGGQASGVSQGLDIAFQMWLQGLQERRQAKTRKEELATGAVFQTDPAAAYKVLGLEAPPDQTAPAGTRQTKQTITRGGTQTTFEAPEELNLVKALDIYTKYAAQSEANETLARIAGGKNYKPRVLPTFDKWLEQTGVLNFINKGIQAKQNGAAKPQKPEVGPDQVLMQAEDGTFVPVHKSRVAEAKTRGLTIVEE